MACHFSGRWIYSVGYFTLNARWIWLVPGTTILVDPAAPKDRMEHSSDMMSTLYQHSPPLRHQPMFSKLPDMYFCRYR